MSETFERDELPTDELVDEPTPSQGRGSEFSSVREFVDWLLTRIGSADIASRVLVHYAESFNLGEGWMKSTFLYLVLVPIAIVLDLAAAIFLMAVVLVLITGVAIAILRGLSVLDELVTLYRHFF